MSAARPLLRTSLCELLGIEYPIVQSGMGTTAGPGLAAAVSNAGGLGILGGALSSAGELREAIREVRARTDRPFGVNLLLAAELRPPAPASAVPDAAVQAVQAALNPMRATLGIPAVTTRPDPPPDWIPGNIQVILEERVPVFSIGLGNPGAALVGDCHRRGIKVIAMVSTVEDARAVEATGLDAVVAQGSEAGGHRSAFDGAAAADPVAIGSFALIPAVAEAVRIPVIAAGGISDGRGFVAALALGATGVMLGTRFVVTRESAAPEHYKHALLRSSGGDTTLTRVFMGRLARVVRNTFSDRYAGSGAPILPFFWQHFAALDIYDAADRQGNAAYRPLWAGQGVGRLRDLPAAGAVVEALVAEARALLLDQLPRAAS